MISGIHTPKRMLFAPVRMIGESRLLRRTNAAGEKPSEGVSEKVSEIDPSLRQDYLNDAQGDDVSLKGDGSRIQSEMLDQEIAKRKESIARPEEFVREVFEKLLRVLTDPVSRTVVENKLRQGPRYVLKLKEKIRDSAALPQEEFMKNPEVNNVRLAQGEISFGPRGIFVNEIHFVTDRAAFEQRAPRNPEGEIDLSGTFLRTPEGKLSLDGASILDDSPNVIILQLPSGIRLYKRYAKIAEENPQTNQELIRIFGSAGADVVTAESNTVNGTRGTVTRANVHDDSGLDAQGGEVLSTLDGRVAGLQAGPVPGVGNGPAATANFIPANEIKRALKQNGIANSALGSFV